MAKPKMFSTYIDCINKLDMLSDEQAGRLYKSLSHYAANGEKPDFSDDLLLQYAFADFSAQIDRDFEKYDEAVERRKESAKVAANARWNKSAEESQCEGMRTHANACNRIDENANACERTNRICEKCDSCQKEKEEENEEDKEKEINKEREMREKRTDKPDFDEWANSILKLFRDICTDFVQPDKLTDHRRRLLYQAQMDGVDFKALFEKAQASYFLSGRKGGNCNIGIDWILEPKNRQKIIEGNYKNRGAPKKKGVYSADNASFDIEKYKRSSLFDD